MKLNRMTKVFARQGEKLSFWPEIVNFPQLKIMKPDY